VAVMQGDNAEEFLRREDRGISIVTTDTFETALRELSRGQHDAVVIQRLVALRLIAAMGLGNLEIVNRPIEGFRQDFCFAVREGDRDTLALLNEGLAIVMADGTYRHLHAKWFAALQLPTDRPIVIGGDDNFPPFEFLDAKGRPAGFNVDLTRAIAAAVGLDIDIQLKPWTQIVRDLEGGKLDAVQGMFYSAERDLTFDFTQPHMVIEYVGVVRRDAGPPPETLDELTGRSIVVQQGDIAHDYLKKNLPGGNIALVDAQEDALRAVVEGRADVALVARLTTLYWVEKHGWDELALGRQPFLSPDYGFAAGSGHKALLAQLAEGLDVLDKRGEYRDIREKWMGVYRQAGFSLASALRALVLVLAPFAVLFLAFVVWSWSLRRQVARKTRALRENIDKFQFVFEAANVGKSLTLPTGEVNANQAFADMLGYTREELQDKRWQDLTPPEDIEATQCRIEPLLKGDRDAIRFEKRYRHRDGHIVWADVSIAIRRDAEGRPLHFVTNVVDISTRKQAEERLQHLTMVLRTLREVNQITTQEKDRDRLLRRACEALTAKRGYRSAWICLRSATGEITAVAESGLGENASAAVRATLAGGALPACCDQVRDQSGVTVMSNTDEGCAACPLACRHSGTAALMGGLRCGERDFGVFVAALPAALADDPEEQSLFKEIAGDIAYGLQNIEFERARKEMEAALAASEKQYRLLADNTLDVIWTMDSDLVFTYVNPAIERLTGHTPEEWVGSRLTDHCEEPHFLEMARIIQTEIEKGDAHSGVVFETEVLRRDKSPILVEIHGKVVFDAQGTLSGLQGVTRDITERRATENALDKSQTLFERVFEFLPVGLWLANKEGRLIRGNPAGVRIWGAEPHVGPEDYSVFKAWRLPSREAVGPEEWALVHTVREGVVVADELLEIETFDGQRKVILNYSAPIHNSSGDVEAAVVVNLDVTKLITAEAALAQSEARLRTLVDTIPDLVWLKDRFGVFLLCNPMFERFYGATESEIIGKTDYEFVEKDLADFFRDHDRAAMASVGPHKNEERLVFTDGSSYQGDFETIKTAMRDDNGNLVGVLGIARDISERKASESMLQTNALRYKSAQRMGGVGNWEYDIQTDTFWGSEGVKLIYGFDPQAGYFTVEEIEGCIPEREKVYQALVDLIEQEKPYNLEFEVHPFDESPPIIIKSIAQLVKDDSGAPQKVAGVIQDITEQKAAEKINRALENQLHQAQKMESVGRLAGGVAHDFNNILSVILGYAELALDDIRPDAPLHGDLKEIINAAQRSRNITRQLLAFARKETIAPEVLDLNAAVENMLKMLRRLIGEDIDLSWQPDPVLWLVSMDPSQVDQILANLCVNARDAIQDVGKVTIETGTMSIDAAYCADHAGFIPGDFVTLMVSDDGCGMDRETLEKVFEPFFTTKGLREGTGLGLATVYGIVKQNKGFINVYSEPGEGTSFRVYLPRHAGEVAARPAIPEAVGAGRGETLLVVEDDPAILKLAVRILEPLNYNVLRARTPEEAIALAEAHNGEIHLLVTDVVMPGMNGRELSDHLTAMYPKLRTLFMSGYTANVIAHRGVLDSDVHFIHKPFSKQGLAAGVRSVLDDVD
jgi:two-component system, cell cycle sensor histidine kinase and response regulator CckA